MIQRYFIRLSYAGTAYNGWQMQENTPNTIQQILNQALSKLLNEEISTLGCGRTDTGVHAREFYAHFDSSNIEISNTGNWIHKFNAVLPFDIAVLEIIKVGTTANARFDAVARTYEYIICRKKSPFLIDRAYYLYGDLDMDLMNEGAAILMSFKDFSSFSKAHTQVKTNDCKVSKAEWKMQEDVLVFTITADRFLRNMVRAIVGTLLELGQKKISLQDLKKIIEDKDRSTAGFSVPAAGLYLVKVDYKEGVLK